MLAIRDLVRRGRWEAATGVPKLRQTPSGSRGSRRDRMEAQPAHLWLPGLRRLGDGSRGEPYRSVLRCSLEKRAGRYSSF